MKVSDIQAIWTHIKALHPNTPETKRPRLSTPVAEVWCRELSGYSVGQVLQAVERQAGKSRYWPDLSEIKAELPRRDAAGATKPQPTGGADARAKAAQEKLFGRMRAERERLIPLRRANGLPATGEEARQAGMSAGAWWKALEEKGLNYPDKIFCEEAAEDEEPEIAVLVYGV